MCYGWVHMICISVEEGDKYFIYDLLIDTLGTGDAFARLSFFGPARNPCPSMNNGQSINLKL